MAKVKDKTKVKTKAKTKKKSAPKFSSYPRYSLEKALRIPRGILEQNAGKECTDEQSVSILE